MNKSFQNFHYLLRLQFLGFRYHGWQKQPGVKTVQEMVEKTINYVLGDGSKFKILGGSRTDAMVSALDFPVELFTEDELPIDFLELLNINLPADIKANSIEAVDRDFNVIQDVILKEYHYRFTTGINKNPFNAHLINHIYDNLDLTSMKEAAWIFEGSHDFSTFCNPFEADTTKTREIELCAIEFDNEMNCHFLRVSSAGFMRYQVRLMMGALVEIGKGNLTTSWLSEALDEKTSIEFTSKAPASGLLLFKVQY